VTVADIVAGALARAGIPRAFVAGGAGPIFVAALRSAGLPLVDVPDAASACVMAAVTGRLGDAPGLAVLGADIDAEAALAAANRDRAPMIVVAPQVPNPAMPLKTSVGAAPESAAHWAAHAAQAAMAEPPGPVWLVIAPGVATRAALPVATAARPAAPVIDLVEVDQVAARLAAAVRPLIIAGRECRAAAVAGWLRALAESLPAPVLVTPAARGALPDPHPLCFGALRSGAAILSRADLVLALGVDDAELAAADVKLSAPVLRLGRTEPWNAVRGVPVAEAAGDVSTLMAELPPRLRDRARADWDVAELDRIRRAGPPPAADPALVTLVTRLREAMPAGTVAVFPPELAPVTSLWHAVSAGDVLVDADVTSAAVAVALERPDGAVLAFGARADAARVAALARAGIEVLTPSRATLGATIDTTVETRGPRVVIVPLPG
jgi:acetolactate synthase I/II/III large subunit